MKRKGNLYAKVYEFENILLAYKKARRNKRFKNEVVRFTERLEENLINIQNHLIWQSYTPGNYRKFIIYEPKRREIMALPFTDRVVQHALNNVIEPIFDSAFIYHSYACRSGKGMHEASKTLSHWLYNLNLIHGEKVYCLQADIAKYFQSINHDILKNTLRKKIKCKETLNLINLIIEHNGGDSGKGIPVGNLTSQLFANVYLNELDRFVKEDLKIHYYMRYMDDFIILSDDKAYLKGLLEVIKKFLSETLDLKLNPKTHIYKVKQGIDYIGYKHWYTHKKLRKGSKIRIRRKIRLFIKLYKEGRISFDKINKSMQSWFGHIKHADTFHLKNRILQDFVLKKND